jgi:membrane protein
MLAYFRTPIPWRDVFMRTASEINDDNCLGLAAQLSFYFLLALFPALLFIVALIGYLPAENAINELLFAVSAVAPPEMVDLLRTQLDALIAGSHASLLTLGILGAIWSSSAAMVAIIDALNRAYDVIEWRSWWKRRLVAIVLTIALTVFLLLSLLLVLVGPDVIQRLVHWFGWSASFPAWWAVFRWPLLLLCVLLALDLVYHFAPNRRSVWVWLTPGSLLATTLWLLASFGFKIYVTNFGNYTATYGAIGGAIVTMLWFYVSGLAILVGAELNAVIEHADKEAGSTAAAAHDDARPGR